MSYRVVNGKIYSVEDISNSLYNAAVKNKSNKQASAFEKILDENIDKNTGFSISNHAAERIKDRNISLNENDMKKINEGINEANKKGSKDCLILYKDVALVTSIKNRTIITAVDKSSSKGNVFTNIDSVVLL
ncbi:TIGR02530 family flagellar biosynthesis protein [Clostridium hydrogenum]|uniref:TIGR02530 family flagellar biosynthesis protein n=1 Tax=Clostridium hydrogenum TaxID=2855764 RepID=UPI001F205708|nr:TIGR02530 family flagellar biosynthesis protein [Clostridium hydrogenum]